MTQTPIKVRVTRFTRIALPFLFAGLALDFASTAQTGIVLNDLSAFKDPGKSWKLAGKVIADMNEANTLKTEKGTGILVNSPGKKDHGSDLYTNEVFSDIDLELDYMIAKNSNSGIYLQGRYELQLHDSWGVTVPTSGNNGGIYERYDESRGKGKAGYEGHAPRQNVSRAPGLWQHLKIAFQAPRFDASGRKTENARIISVQLNGIVIHDNVELTGPTRGGLDNNEVAEGPLRFQGDHGAVAFRNINIKRYKGQPPVLTNIHYRAYYSKYETIPDFSTLKPDEEGDLKEISTSFLKKDNAFLIRYTGFVKIDQPGEFIFQRETNGKGSVKINNQEVSNIYSYTTKPIHLDAGSYPFEIVYTKPSNWFPTSLGLFVSGTTVREFLISEEASLFREYPDPIHIEVRDRHVNRSFMDISEEKRVVHSANVGTPQQFHYSYDMDNGTIYQVWRGNFLDATPMWYSRGDGSSKPLGSLLHINIPRQSVIRLTSINDQLNADTSATLTTKGYELENENRTAFIYKLFGATIRDAFEVDEKGQALKRIVDITDNPGNLFMRIAEGKTIENIAKGWYIIDDNTYYIRIDDPAVSPVIKQNGDRTELLAPLKDKLSYSILF